MRWSAIVLAALSACSPGHVPDDDNASSAPATDAGVASIDAGFAATDAGAPSIDAGSIFTDVPGADAGVTPANGGPATADAGAAGTDAGTARIDAGTIAACDDGTGDGTLELDAGPPPRRRLDLLDRTHAGGGSAVRDLGVDRRSRLRGS